MTLEEILNNDKDFTDDLELTIKGEKVTLGGLRDLSKSQQRKLSASLEEAAGARNAAAADQQKARDLAEKAATLIAQLEAAPRTPAVTDDFENDAFWAPVKKRTSTLEARLEETLKTLKETQGQFANAATIWAKERWKSQYERGAERLKKTKEYADWDMNKVVDYATKNRSLDEYGMPSVERAIADLTRANDIEEIKRQAREEGFKEGQQRSRLNLQPRPSGAAGGRPDPNVGLDPSANFNDLADSVYADPELSDMLAQLGSLRTEDIQ